MPYNFSDPTTGNFTLKAHWRLDGGYKVKYLPDYDMGDGTIINGTMDQQHVETAVPLLAAGYDMLLEKPFALNEDELRTLTDTVRRYGGVYGTAHLVQPTFHP